MKLLKKITSLCWPSNCILCQARGDSYLDLCQACRADLPWLLHSCTQCGKILPAAEFLCGQCIQSPPAFHQTIALFNYQLPIDQLIVAMKFHNKLLYANIFGHLLAETLQQKLTAFPDVIIPMPLHRQRLRQRGYNQALELARPLAKKLQIPLDIKSCERIKMTAAQSSLSFDARKNNMKNAFSIRENFTAKSVLIIDDVITSGETCNALSLTLRKKGVEKIIIAGIAKAGN